MRSLEHKKIVVTRAKAQAGSFVEKLQEAGADVFRFPTIQIAPPDAPPEFGDIGQYDWVIFTSTNVVKHFFSRLGECGVKTDALKNAQICAIGPFTADAIKKHSLGIDLIPEKHVAENLLRVLLEMEGGVTDKRFLIPHGDLARKLLPEELCSRGAIVTEIIVYRTIEPDVPEELCDELVSYTPDIVTFTSSSTAENFCNILGEERIGKIAEKALFASIGPITTQTAEECGLKITIEPQKNTINGLVEAIIHQCEDIDD